MVKQFQNGGQATGAQEQLIQAFMLDLGSVLGAKNEQEALQIGQATVQKLGKNAGKLFQAWGQAESQQQGAGRQVIAEALGGNQQRSTAQATIGSMQPTYNVPPTSTAYGDNPNAVIAAKKGLKISQLNGHCPEDYEVEKYLVGGCVKCKKKKQDTLAKQLKNSKKRINKKAVGGEVQDTKTYYYSPGSYSKDGKDRLLYAEKNGGLLESFKCGGKKKRFKKCEDGGDLDFLKCGGKKKAAKKCEAGTQIPEIKCGKKVSKTKKCENGATIPELKCGGKKKKVCKAKCGKELPELKCGGKGRVKKHEEGGVLDWLRTRLAASKPINWESLIGSAL